MGDEKSLSRKRRLGVAADLIERALRLTALFPV